MGVLYKACATGIMNRHLIWISIIIFMTFPNIGLKGRPNITITSDNTTVYDVPASNTIIPWTFTSVSFHGRIIVALIENSHGATTISRVITNGTVLVKTIHNSYRRLRHCHIEYNPSLVANVLRKIRFEFHGQYVRNCLFSQSSSYGEVGNFSNIVNDCEDFITRKHKRVISLSRYNPIAYLFIVPGTKWCGISNKADNYEDLGAYPDEDVCCRDHDYCKLSVHSLETGYGYLNLDVKTISHCECDKKFFSCLRLIGSSKAYTVLNIYQYFQRNCFDVADKFRCVEWNWGMCVKQDTVPTAVIRSDVR